MKDKEIRNWMSNILSFYMVSCEACYWVDEGYCNFYGSEALGGGKMFYCEHFRMRYHYGD